MEEDIKENIFHIRILYYLMLKYPDKIKSIYEIAKYYKKGNNDEYGKARKNLIEHNYIIDNIDGMSLNYDKEQFKLFKEKIEAQPELIHRRLEKYQDKYFNNFLEPKKAREILEKIWKINQEQKSLKFQ